MENIQRHGIAEIVYYVQTKESGSQVLKRSDNLYPYPEFEEKGTDPTLCEHVKSLAFTFLDEEDNRVDLTEVEGRARTPQERVTRSRIICWMRVRERPGMRSWRN